jgi:restriction system protein
MNLPIDSDTALAAAIGLVTFGGLLTAVRRGRSSAAVKRGASRALVVASQREFNSLVAQAFRLQGYQIVDTGVSADADLILRRDRETLLVLCRHWNSTKVDVAPLTRLHAAIAARGANGGIALTSGRFARNAAAFAQSGNIKLIEGAALEGLLDKARVSRRTPA